MPEGNPTLLDIVKMNGSDLLTGLIEECIYASPEVAGYSNLRDEPVANVGSARTIKGIGYKTLVRTELPTFSFRDANDGVARSKSKWENRYVECSIANPQWGVDKAIAMAHEDGWEAFLGLEAIGHVKAMLLGLSRQFYYGAPSDSDKGFPGIQSAVDSSMVVDAAGTTASTGSSVYAVKFGPQNVQWIAGMEGELTVTDPREQSATGTNGQYTELFQEMNGWIGLQVGSKYSVARIKDLTADEGCTLDDDKLADLIAKFPAGVSPDALFMTRRSQTQWKKSRTATNATGAPAPTPRDYEGIPVFITDGILDTETLT